MKGNSKILILAACFVLGIIITAITLNNSNNLESDTPPAATVAYGQHIIRNTALVLGSGQSDPDKQYSGTNMDCASCHIDSGQLPGTLNLLQASVKYPKYSGRDGRESDLKDRINGCMQRSMNGRPIPRDSIEMQ